MSLECQQPPSILEVSRQAYLARYCPAAEVSRIVPDSFQEMLNEYEGLACTTGETCLIVPVAEYDAARDMVIYFGGNYIPIKDALRLVTNSRSSRFFGAKCQIGEVIGVQVAGKDVPHAQVKCNFTVSSGAIETQAPYFGMNGKKARLDYETAKSVAAVFGQTMPISEEGKAGIGEIRPNSGVAIPEEKKPLKLGVKGAIGFGGLAALSLGSYLFDKFRGWLIRRRVGTWEIYGIRDPKTGKAKKNLIMADQNEETALEMDRTGFWPIDVLDDFVLGLFDRQGTTAYSRHEFIKGQINTIGNSEERERLLRLLDMGKLE